MAEFYSSVVVGVADAGEPSMRSLPMARRDEPKRNRTDGEADAFPTIGITPDSRQGYFHQLDRGYKVPAAFIGTIGANDI
jgi:hypothetical protein